MTVKHEDGSCVNDGTNILGIVGVVLLFTLVLGLAGSVDIATLKAQLHRRRGILCGLLCQFFLMPAISYLVVTLANPPEHVALMLLILASSSGGAYSNWWCSLFNADLALSVAMTAVSTLCCAVMLPLNMLFYVNLLFDADIDLPWTELAQSVGVVSLAIVLGVLISTKLPKFKDRMSLIGNMSGIFLIVLTAVGSVVGKKKSKNDGPSATPPWRKPADFYAVVASPFFVAVLTSLGISSLGCLCLVKPERVAITVEVSYQNIGIASAVALSAFCHDPAQRSDATAVPLIYGVLEAVVLGLFCVLAWKMGWTYAPADVSLFTAIRGDFQLRSVVVVSPESRYPRGPVEDVAESIAERAIVEPGVVLEAGGGPGECDMAFGSCVVGGRPAKNAGAWQPRIIGKAMTVADTNTADGAAPENAGPAPQGSQSREDLLT